MPVVEDENYDEYSNMRKEVLDKVNELEQLRRKTELVKKYKHLLQTKIGERQSIQRNLPVAGRDELHEEMTKLRIILEKLVNLPESKKVKLKALLIRGGDAHDVEDLEQ